MERLHFSIDINAPREKVWKTMLEDQTYREWTTAFMPGSYYEGDWSEGSKIAFLGPGENGKVSGMVARVKESRPPERVAVEHYGVVQDGVEDTSSAEAAGWAGGQEAYTFRQKNGSTEVLVDVDTHETTKTCSTTCGHAPSKSSSRFGELTPGSRHAPPGTETASLCWESRLVEASRW